MKTNVYIDGFNLYYGCIKGTPYHWLNIAKLCELLLPENEIAEIKYFTALVSARPHDPNQPVRQQTYIRALQTLPNVTVVYGRFLKSTPWMPRADSTTNPPKNVQVIKTEEKGSDVNLATHLLIDCFLRKCKMAVVVSNDSDLFLPIQYVSTELKIPVGILNPFPKPSWQLQKVAHFIKPIRPGPLSASLFPDEMIDSNGTFRKPVGW